MANPTEAVIIAQWQAAVDLLEETSKYGRSNSKNVLAMLNTLETAYAGDWLDEAEGAAQAIRAAVAGVVSRSVAAAIQRPFLKQYLKSVVGRTDLQSDDEMFDELYRYYVENGKRVQSRAFTFGSPAAAGANVGTTQIIRLTKDQYNYDIEASHIDSKRALCVLDANTGTDPGREVWQLIGQARPKDDLEFSGSGDEGVLVGATADDSFLNNASWSGFGGTASVPTSIDSWTSNVAVSSSLCTFDSTNYFRAAPSEGSTPYAIKLLASVILSQKLTVKGTDLDPNVPMLMAVAWNRSIFSAAGTVYLRMGGTTTTITLAAQSGWQITLVPVTPGQSDWYRLFQQNDLECSIEFARNSGSLLVDDVLFIPGTAFDGHWYWQIPSSATYVAPRINDKFTFADIATDSKVQKWIYRGFRRYLPHSLGSSITFADP